MILNLMQACERCDVSATAIVAFSVSLLPANIFEKPGPLAL